MKTIRLIGPMLLLLFIFSCGENGEIADGYGNFEAREIMVSAEATGTLAELLIREGDRVKKGEIAGRIDCEAMSLQKEQVLASLSAIDDKTLIDKPQIQIYQSQLQAGEQQIDALREKRRVLLVELERMQNLVADEAAPQKNLDDIEGQLAVLEKEIKAAESKQEVIRQQISAVKQTTANKNQGIISERKPLEKRAAQIEEQLEKCTITHPIDGTVLELYTEVHEFTAPGHPLYKLADLSQMTLRVYLSARQIPQIHTGQAVTVKIDHEEGLKNYKGTVRWIASEAEFTPKIIQTKEERVNLVYAVDIGVPNDGDIKIGMPGEVWFQQKD